MRVLAVLTLLSLAPTVHADIALSRAAAGAVLPDLLLANGPDSVPAAGPYHIYLQFLPKEGEEPERALTRMTLLHSQVRALMPKAAPERDSLVLGQRTIRWTVTAWDGPTALIKRTAARGIIADDPSVRLFIQPVPPSNSKSRSAVETAKMLESRVGAVTAYFEDDFGPGFPAALLSWEGGTVFDNAEHAAKAAGLPVAGLLFDPDNQRARTTSEIITLAKALPRSHTPTMSDTVPPPPLEFDSIVGNISTEQDLSPDIIRSLIYASKGYEGGYPKRVGLKGPMGLSNGSAEWAGVPKGKITDPEASIRGGAVYYKKLLRIFSGDQSRAVAAYYCGVGRVRKSQTIPQECTAFLGRFQLAFRNGAGWALAPGTTPKRTAPPEVVPEKEVKPIEAVVRPIKEKVKSIIEGEPGVPATGRRESFLNVPTQLVAAITREATNGRIQVDPNAMIALAEAEGGVNAGTSSAGAKGVLQLTWETAKWECGFTSRSQLWDQKQNIDCSERVFKRRVDKADGDFVLAWALYNTKVKWHSIMTDERRVANIKETVRHVTRAAYRYYQLTGKWLLEPESAAFRKYFNSKQSRQWSRDALADVQRWDRNEMGISTTRTVARQAWRLNSKGTYCYRRDPSGRKKWALHRVPAGGCSSLAI